MTAIALNPHQSSAEAQKSMKERPILFSGPMVRALLDGSKTQTRRVVKLKPHQQIEERDDGSLWPWMYDGERDADSWLACPYGQPGDRLWVREAWARPKVFGTELVVYRESDSRTCYDGPWKPSIHMPRRASRITLEITGVLVERLQDISCHDALAEGIPRTRDGFGMPDGSHFHCDDPRQSYYSLWEAINGPGSVEANPWVWVVEFQRVKGLAT